MSMSISWCGLIAKHIAHLSICILYLSVPTWRKDMGCAAQTAGLEGRSGGEGPKAVNVGILEGSYCRQYDC